MAVCAKKWHVSKCKGQAPLLENDPLGLKTKASRLIDIESSHLLHTWKKF
jgi:hypothetical protein